jgi:hypothetical protein
MNSITLFARNAGFSKLPLETKMRELKKPLNQRRNYTVPFLKEYIKNQIFNK